jgi:hypothetical protein
VNILRTLRFAAFGAVVSIAGYLTLSATQLAARTSEPTSTLIIPGQGAGPLKLGDTRTKVLKLFPFKPDVDQEFPQEPDCGIELNWVDMKNPKYGNVFIRFRDNTAFQIDVATNRYRTSQGITTDSSPQEVRKHYAGLHSYILSEITNEALGGRPLVYWIDREHGIAFAFAYAKTERKRYLYEIIVFRPKSEICPADDSINSPAKRELTPYSLEPSDMKADRP